MLPFLVLCFVGIITYAIGFIADLYKAVAGSGKQDGSKVASGIVSGKFETNALQQKFNYSSFLINILYYSFGL